MAPLISVIIPVYNVEKYLRRCLDSVVAQTYRNLEIICVDDGSVDESGKICDQYAVRDARIKVIHQENQGLSAARNRGLDAAEGAYIAFVDSDDYILEDMYKKMLDKLLDYNVDLCVCQWQYEFSDGRQVVKKQNIDPAIYGNLKRDHALTISDTIEYCAMFCPCVVFPLRCIRKLTRVLKKGNAGRRATHEHHTNS